MEEGKDIHTCKLCSYRCHSSFVMYKHIDLHKRRPKIDIFTCDSKIPEMFDCAFCEFNTNLKVDLIEHIRVIHSGEEANEELENIFKSYRCEDCDFETHSVIVLTKHLDDCNAFGNIQNKARGKTKNNIKQTYLEDLNYFKCDQCPFKARNRMNINGHKRRMHSKAINWLQCDQCEYVTKVREYLTTHVKRRHVEKKWLRCEHCEFKCLIKETLKGHINIKHTYPEDVERFECEDCPYETHLESYLKKHIRKCHRKKKT